MRSETQLRPQAGRASDAVCTIPLPTRVAFLLEHDLYAGVDGAHSAREVGGGVIYYSGSRCQRPTTRYVRYRYLLVESSFLLLEHDLYAAGVDGAHSARGGGGTTRVGPAPNDAVCTIPVPTTVE